MNEKKQKLVSIVTVCLNSELTIRDTMESVKKQSYPAIEHIIIDGVSTDKTLQIVSEYTDGVAKVISEKDGGIYDAMNKGFENTTGDIIYFLNSDDVLYDADVVKNVVEMFESQSQPEIVFGDVIYKSSTNEEVQNFKSVTRYNLIYRDLCHQVVFASRLTFEKFGLFNLDYRIAADFDWLLKVFLSGTRVAHLNKLVSVFNTEGEHGRDIDSARIERMAVKLQYQSKFRYILGNFIYRVVRKIRTGIGA